MTLARAFAALLALALPAAAQLDADFTATPLSGTNPVVVTLTDTTTGGEVLHWNWDFGDGTGSFEQHPVHVFSQPGPHTVRLTVFTTLGFDLEQKLDLVHVDAAPLVPDFSADVTSGPMALSVSFTDATTGSTPTDWLWDFGDGSTSTEQHPVHAFTTPGTYSVTLTSFLGLQFATVTQRNLIEVFPAELLPDLSAEPAFGSHPLMVQFSDVSTDAHPTGWLWDFGDDTTSDEQHPSHVYQDPGSYAVTLTTFLAGASATVAAPTVVQATGALCHEDLKWSYAEGALLDRLGAAVAIDGTNALVGAPRTDGNATSTGAAYLVDVVTGAPGPVLTRADAQGGDSLGTAVALAGDLALVSAPVSDSASLFDAVTGEELHRLVPSPLLGAYVGASVALHGDLAIVGAPDTAHSAIGAVHLFDVATGEHLGRLTDPEGVHGDVFGASLDTDEGLLVVGAPEAGDLGPKSGSASLFDLTTGTRLLRLLPADGAAYDNFGSAVAIDDGRVVVGAPGHDDGADRTGAVYVFDAATGAQLDKLSLGPANVLHVLGGSVALAGTTLLATSTTWQHQPGGRRAVLFDIVSGQHLATLRSSDIQPHHFFASSVALSDEHALIGAMGADGAVPESGAAYVFDAALGTWTDLGKALAGAAGEPVLVGGGPLLGGCAVDFILTDAASAAPVLFVAGLSSLGLPLKGGVLVPSPDVLVGLVTNGNGVLVLTETWPEHLPPGASWIFQAWIADAGGPSGWAASNGLSATTP